MSKATPSPYAELDWRPWEIDSLDGTPKPTEPEPVVEPEEPTIDMEAILAEVAELKELARQQGHAEGYAAGFDKGQQEGQAQGHTEGFNAGHAQAVARGHQEGFEAGSVKSAQQCEQLAALVNTSVVALEQLHEEVGQALLQLAIQVAQQVLQDELKQHPEHVAELLTQMLKDAEHKEQTLTVLAHPDDCTLIQQHLADDFAHNPSWRLKADTEITAGGVLITTALGEINATLESRWRRVLARLGPIDTPTTTP